MTAQEAEREIVGIFRPRKTFKVSMEDAVRLPPSTHRNHEWPGSYCTWLFVEADHSGKARIGVRLNADPERTVYWSTGLDSGGLSLVLLPGSDVIRVRRELSVLVAGIYPQIPTDRLEGLREEVRS